jgi:hypothetical protein
MCSPTMRIQLTSNRQFCPIRLANPAHLLNILYQLLVSQVKKSIRCGNSEPDAVREFAGGVPLGGGRCSSRRSGDQLGGGREGPSLLECWHSELRLVVCAAGVAELRQLREEL